MQSRALSAAVSALTSALVIFGATAPGHTAEIAGPAETQSATPATGVASARQRAVTPEIQRLPLTGVDSSAVRDAPAAAAPPTGDAVAAAMPRNTVTDDQPEVLTDVLQTKSFNLVGFLWDASSTPTGAAIQVRVREGSLWSGWELLDMADGGPDPGSQDARSAAGRAATEPLFVDAADALQVRADVPGGKALQNLEAILVDPGISATDAHLPETTTTLVTGADGIAPYVINRSQWGADEGLRTCEPATNSTMQMAFVHHTDSINDYSPDQVPAMIRSIYAFHVQGRGWCDVGYNFLVDKYGRLFEGRYGGIDKAVVGAHAAGFNGVSFGISMIGNYSTAHPTSGMLDAMEHLIGWKLALYGRNPVGLATVISAGSPRFPEGTIVSLNVISEHRNTGFTECPGVNVYALMGPIRAGAALWVDRALHSPSGGLDQASPISGGIFLRGWALDPDTTDSSYVWIDISGRGFPLGTPFPRPDIGTAYPGYGPNHGFQAAIPAWPGSYRVCVIAINTGPGQNTPLGCAVITVGGVPFGRLDQATAIPGGIFLSGWALDPDTTDSSYVWIDIAGHGFPLGTPFPRPEIAAAYPGYGPNHGFQAAVPAAPGTYRVCAIAINTGFGPNNPIGCHTTIVR